MNDFKMGIRIRAPISKEHLEKDLYAFCEKPFAVFPEPVAAAGDGRLFTVLFEDDDDRCRFIQIRRGEIGRAP